VERCELVVRRMTQLEKKTLFFRHMGEMGSPHMGKRGVGIYFTLTNPLGPHWRSIVCRWSERRRGGHARGLPEMAWWSSFVSLSERAAASECSCDATFGAAQMGRSEMDKEALGSRETDKWAPVKCARRGGL